MDIKNSAITAKMVIHSLLALLENENVDISSVKFKVGSDGNGYESPEFELEKLVSLAIDGLVEIEEANAMPELDVAEKIELIIRDVAELPDRTSPEDWPEALIVTSGELEEILTQHLIEKCRNQGQGE